MKTYDAVIIGFGKGGKTLALELARHGWSVAMIERSDRMYGGTCINIGCIPTKFLLHKAHLATSIGLSDAVRQASYYQEAIAAKGELTDSLRELNYRKLAGNDRITVFTGEGRFVSPNVVAVRLEEGVEEIRGREIIVNTGAETVIPPIEGVARSRHTYTSTSIMELGVLPRHLIVIGGGYIGLEFASMYASFGSRVTVLEGFSELIPREDRDIAEEVRNLLETKGIDFRLNASVTFIRDDKDQALVGVTDAHEGRSYEIAGDAVLLATGRRPATAALDLAAAGIETDERGAIRVDEHLRTSVPHIHAVGDVTGGLQFTYISLDDYRIVRDDLLGKGLRTTGNRGPVPYSVFIEPTLSHVGMHETEARKAGIAVRVNRIRVASIPRARILGPAEGVLKATIDAKNDRILGCTLFCPESSEAINIVALAMKHGITARELSGSIYTHPSMSESLNDLFA